MTKPHRKGVSMAENESSQPASPRSGPWQAAADMFSRLFGITDDLERRIAALELKAARDDRRDQ
jgi:hypothetical protein